MHTRRNTAITCAVTLCPVAVAVAGHAQPAATPTAHAAREAAAKVQAKEMRYAAAADYKAARARCDAKSDNDKDVCIKVAKSFLANAQARASAKASAAR